MGSRFQLATATRNKFIKHRSPGKSLIRAFRKYANAGLFDDKSDWYILAVAQHNGLPTRCMDWTASPFVAAHFVCANEQYKNQDGIIWCLQAERLRDINMENSSKATRLKGISWVFDTRLLEESFKTLNVLDKTQRTRRKNKELMLLWKPPSLDARIANQSALFTIMNGRAESHLAFLQKYSLSNPDLVTRIVIAASSKSKIRDMLDQNNISERTLFPGLPGLCSWLKRYYGMAW